MSDLHEHPQQPETESAEQWLSRELGVDVPTLELDLAFALDLARMKRGEPGQLGYLLLDRQHNPDAVVVFADPATARDALDAHPLIDALCEEDCLDTRVPDPATLSDLSSREVILP